MSLKQNASFAVKHYFSRNLLFGISSRPTTRRRAIMNLALRGIEADFGHVHAKTFRSDLCPDLRADYVLANPQFNNSDIALSSRAFVPDKFSMQKFRKMKDRIPDLEIPSDEVRIMNCFPHYFS